MSSIFQSRYFRSLLLIFFFAIGLFLFFFLQEKPGTRPVTFFVNYNGFLSAVSTQEENISIQDALTRAGYVVHPEAIIFPSREERLLAGTHITIIPAIRYTISDQEETKEYTKPATTVEEALAAAGVKLEGADFVEPATTQTLNEGVVIHVTRVTVSEETEDTKIPFEKSEVEDATLSWQTKKIVQKGIPGIRTSVYKVSRHNGKVVAKEKIKESVTTEPVSEKTVIGTKVTVIKKHTGGASWYAHTGTLAAANPWLPFGSYVRVTNTANGKSVIVKINDRGPFGGGRIIDLDRLAFAKIADIGTGVINVLMEEIR